MLVGEPGTIASARPTNASTESKAAAAVTVKVKLRMTSSYDWLTCGWSIADAQLILPRCLVVGSRVCSLSVVRSVIVYDHGVFAPVDSGMLLPIGCGSTISTGLIQASAS
jgi:hypothetical protein